MTSSSGQSTNPYLLESRPGADRPRHSFADRIPGIFHVRRLRGAVMMCSPEVSGVRRRVVPRVHQCRLTTGLRVRLPHHSTTGAVGVDFGSIPSSLRLAPAICRGRLPDHLANSIVG